MSPRFPISRLMVLVGVVALNLASARFWSHSSSPSLLTGRVLTSLALQVGLYCSIRHFHGRWFPFWVGFVASCLAAALTSIDIDFFNEGDSKLAGLMDTYLFHSYGWIGRILSLIHCRLENGSLLDNLVYEVVSFVPHLAAALIGGLFAGLTARLLFGRRFNRDRRAPQ